MVSAPLVSSPDVDTELIPEIVPLDARLSISGPVADFLPLLVSGAAITPAKEVIPNTSFVKIEASDGSLGEHSSVKLTATDGDRSVLRVASDLNVHLAGDALLPGKKLLDILRLAPESIFRLDVFPTNATVRSGRAVWTIQLPTSTAFPAFTQIDDLTFFEVDRSDLLSALETANTATAKSSARMSLTQLQVTKSHIVGCDGARSHRMKVESLPKSLGTTIPSSLADSFIRELRTFTGNTVFLASTSSTVALKLGEDVVTGQRLTLKYPNIEHLMLEPAMLNTESLTVPVRELRESIVRVRVNADPDLATVFLAVRMIKNEWTVSVRAVDRYGNSSQEAFHVEYDGDKPKEYALNHKYLLDFLDSLSSGADKVTLKLGEDKKTPLYASENRFSGVLMPMSSGFSV